ncbi:MAG: alcohol dehydrogenase catalytic domain-containing protein [Clostridia bacterium]|nr:alcohol dehydrogenase catalytic domain-containing protein [Clostridia bacterium]
MRCVVIEKPNKVYMTERELPILAKGFARIKVKAAAICATDLEVVEGNIPANYPITPGHEWSGVVAEVADENNSHWVGKRVTGSNDVSCGVCEACRSGNWRYCKDFEEIGFKRHGAYAEYIDVPAYGLVELPDDLPFTHAALAEPLGVALGSWEKVQPEYGKTCLIIGAGSIGLCCLAVAKAIGMRKIVVVATSSKGLAIAKKMGAYATVATREEDLFEAMKKYHPEGTDYIMEATGVEECISNSLKLCKKGGSVALVGYGRGKTMSIRIDDIHINNLRLIGAGNNWNQHKKAIQMMADGVVDMEPMVTETLDLSEFQKGLDDAKNRPAGFVKAIFTFDDK